MIIFVLISYSILIFSKDSILHFTRSSSKLISFEEASLSRVFLVKTLSNDISLVSKWGEETPVDFHAEKTILHSNKSGKANKGIFGKVLPIDSQILNWDTHVFNLAINIFENFVGSLKLFFLKRSFNHHLKVSNISYNTAPTHELQLIRIIKLTLSRLESEPVMFLCENVYLLEVSTNYLPHKFIQL